MKRLLLAVVFAAFAVSAQAQWITHDPTSNLQRMLEFARSTAMQYQQVKMAVAQVESTARNVGSGNVGAVMGGLSTYSLPGTSVITGAMGGRNVVGNSQTFLQRDRLYAPREQDEWAREMERRESVTAAANAMAEEGMRRNEEDIRRMVALERQLSATNAVVDAQLLGVELNGFRERQEGHARTLKTIDTMLMTANRTDALRAEQMQRRDSDQWRERSAAAMGGDTRAITSRSLPSSAGFLGW